MKSYKSKIQVFNSIYLEHEKGLWVLIYNKLFLNYILEKIIIFLLPIKNFVNDFSFINIKL
jgi:hypothetical protein